MRNGTRAGTPRRKGFGAREPVAETPPHHVAAHEHPAAGLRIVVGKNVDQPDDKIGVGGRKDHLQLDIDGSREGHIPVERLGDEGQHIGTVRHEALVGEHILFGAAFAEGFDIGHRVGRIGRIGGGGAFGRRAAGFETSAVGEVEGELTRFARRPAVESMPAVVARRENRGGGKRVRGALALEVMVEEREFEMLHIVFPRRFAPEIERSEFSAAVAPCSVRPRSHDQMARRCGTLPDHGPVEVPRPETILGVERPSDDQHGRLYVVAGPAQVARLPPCVVGGVFGKLFPERIGTLKFRKFGQRRMFPEERPLVGAGPLRHRGHLFGRSMARRGVHAAQETVGVGEHQHAVVADVVAMNQSVTGACGETAFTAGWVQRPPIMA